MDESQSGKSPAYEPDQPSYEEERQRTRTRTSGSLGTPTVHRRSSETNPQDNRQRSPVTFESENLDILDDFAFEDDTEPWSDRRSTSRSPQSAGRRSPEKQDKDKGKARGKERVAMSSGPGGGGGGTSQSGTSEEPSHRERIAQLPTPMYPGKDQKGQEAKPKARREAISAQAQAPALAAIDQGWSRGSL
ncbi:hypothetical protein LTR99_000496 [Exophiala xenobiotica]|uniref:Uncharacterized protein n=1 Tax=Vermiconidia calcicola TaxID=1690605 RepID=A0AAV9QHW9_9PEZI|nr:hypothetical protein LTR92_003082 [Exophiala xenobiotica]KAK5543677.1 hypothetical protein LTR25_001291 [Vermiconidia calcicola]KAK5548354.1 hypothetical protein LTR23_001483 [Chaetothyriales sp. CCFEE 6169]KAK5213516.1 hypothetical protein LTR41_001095 [Exophiala xenobiotica]KAK5307524.1 hypothetical protein LTR99_000496 [Exophiala xenobiotica]